MNLMNVRKILSVDHNEGAQNRPRGLVPDGTSPKLPVPVPTKLLQAGLVHPARPINGHLHATLIDGLLLPALLVPFLRINF